MFIFEPSGKHRVGAFDLLTELGNEGVLARIFYPTEAEIGAGHNYTEPEYALGILDFVRWNRWLGRLMTWATGRQRLCCAWQGKLIDSGDRLPVILYSHGLGGQRHVYSSVCVELASHGYIVAAVEHRDGSASMTFVGEEEEERGEAAEGASELKRRWLPYWRHPLSDFPVRNRQVQQRAKECRLATDALLQLNSGGHICNRMPDTNCQLERQFQGRIDTDRIHVMGHSFGGATAFTAVAEDKQGLYKTCCLHDIWMHPVDPEHYGSVKLPTLYVNNEKFHWETNVKRIKSTMEHMEEGKFTNLTIRGTNHAAQSDSGLFMPFWLSRKLGFTGSMEPREALVLTAKLSRLFIDRHEGRQLSQEDDLLLNGQTDACFADFTFVPDDHR